MNREIGPIGTATRLIGGVIAIGLPIALDGIGWWDVGIALIALPIVALDAGALVASAYQRYAPEALGAWREPATRDAPCSGPACWTWAIMIVAAVGLIAVTPASAVAFWVWLGASLLIAAARGYGGCELLALPNLIRGRREQIGCMLYGPVDALERRRGRHAPGAPAS
jgi:hypothetical protein